MEQSGITRRAVLAGLAHVPLVVAAGTAAHAVDTPDQSSRTGRRVFLAGDSVTAPKSVDARPETGWGMALPFYLSPLLPVENHARNGRSSKSFVDEGRLEPILAAASAGDVLVIQFGHNDSKSGDPTRYTEPWTTYQEYLTRYVTGARAAGAVPVLATPVERRRFDGAGDAYSTHGDYPDAMRALAAELDVALVDTQRETLDLWQRLGPDGTRAYFDITADHEDNTHLSPRGAAAVALMVARGLRAAGVVGPGDLRRLQEVPADDWFTWLPEQPS